MTVSTVQRLSVWSYLGWALVGTLLTLSVVAPLTIGPFAGAVAVAGGIVLLARRATRNASALGLLSGLGTIPLYVAVLNRDGPGMICSAVGTNGGECTQEMSPWPWLVVGVVLVAAGIALFVRFGRRRPA